MAPLAAVSVHDDFAAGQATVTHGASHHKAPGGIDIVARVAVDHFTGDDLLNHLFNDRIAQFVIGNVRLVLRGNHNGIHPQRRAVLVFDGHLRLAVRTQKVQGAVFANLGQTAG